MIPPGPPAGHTGDLPWVRLRSAASGHQLYKRMLGDADPKARPGDIVAVYDKADAPYGIALYNPKSLISLRLLHRGKLEGGLDALFAGRLGRAVALRRETLGLDKTTDAYRLVHDQGDGLPGLVVDRYAGHLVLEFYSYAMLRQAERLERLLKTHYPGAKFVRRASEHAERMEGFRIQRGDPVKTRIRENGVVFEVEPSGGCKTGFFCDQRENRLAFAGLAAGRRVLDVCSYTGGFALYAKTLGGAGETTMVELDAEASAMAVRNANLNKVRVNAVCVDAFPYMRQAGANNERFGLIALDPHKLIASTEGYREGRGKYLDLNRLAIGLLEPGGILLSCSCSGMLPWEDFQAVLRTAAGSAGRRLQVLRKSGAGPDHPFAVDHPEGEYLKAVWCLVP